MYRGDLLDKVMVDSLREGSVFVDKGFVSTSKDPSTAREFFDIAKDMARPSESPVMFAVQLKPSSKVLPLGNTNRDFADQKEMLLPRDLQFTVTRIQESGGQRVIWLEAV